MTANEQSYVDPLLLSQMRASQDRRRRRADARLPRMNSQDQLAAMSSSREFTCGFFDGQLRALGAPILNVHDAQSEELAYYERHTGTFSELLVADGGPSALQALNAVLGKARRVWITEGATGASVAWPARDFDISSALGESGFLNDAYLSTKRLARRTPTPEVKGLANRNVVIRRVQLSDTSAAMALRLSVVDTHVGRSPFARFVNTIEPVFRERLAIAIAPHDRPAAGPIVLVVDICGEVVGMVECIIRDIPESPDAMLTPGRWGLINSLAIAESHRRRGLASRLVGAATRAVAARGAHSVFLWISEYNPIAATFWAGHGFEPLWVAYQAPRPLECRAHNPRPSLGAPSRTARPHCSSDGD